GGILELSNQALSVGTCAVLGKILQTTNNIIKASFEDCLLDEDGSKSLLLGICGNTSLNTLSFKGNNLHGAAAHALAKMIRHNSSVVRLSLEWNSLGLCLESWSDICEAISCNNSLQYLDLRSNQLNPEAAQTLAKAIIRNSTLTIIDLRWNSIGWSGGKAILEALKHNKIINKIELPGNNIPNNILLAIGNAMGNNMRNEVVNSEYRNRTEILKQQIENQEHQAANKIQQLEDTLAKTDLTLNKTIKEGMFSVGHLEEELRSKKLEVESLTSKLEVATTSQRLSVERLAVLEGTVAQLQEALKHSQEKAQQQAAADKEVFHQCKSQYEKEVRALNETINRLEAQVSEQEFTLSSQRNVIADCKENVCVLQSELKGSRAHFEEQENMERNRHKEALRQLEQQHNTELQRLKAQQHQLQSELQERLSKSESMKTELEGELTNVRVQAASDRTAAHAQTETLKHQLKAEHSGVIRGLREEMSALEQSRNDAEERLRAQLTTNGQLTAANAKLSHQLRALNNQISQLQTEIDGKTAEISAAEARVRAEVKQQLEDLETQRRENTKLQNSIASLQRNISENQVEHESQLRKKDEEIRRVRQEAKAKETELLRIREDEARRVGMLHSAFMSYLTTSPQSPVKQVTVENTDSNT
ncbi:unnamed protein product, partial [Meganyctiphanes norvegica]